MPLCRRSLLARAGLGAALAACGWPPARAAAAKSDDAAFDATTPRDAMRALGDVVLDDPRLTLTLPDVVENGAVVPISVEWRVPAVSDVYVVVEGNPNPAAVQFRVHEGVDPLLSLRLKMAASGTVYALVRAGGKVYATSRTAQVTVGGCG
jgi:sulfur-oxidizing protein SoxY